jgi:chaperonin GroES
MNLTPLHDRVIVKPAAAEEVTKGGIIIPDTVKEKPRRGEIVAIGAGKVAVDGKATPLTVKVGDSVLYGKYAGTEVSVDDVDYLIMPEADILAIYSVS